MKHFTFTCLFISMLTLSLWAQPKEGVYPMSQGANNGFFVLIKDANRKIVERKWEKFIDKYDGKTKRDKKNDEYFTDNATMRAISNNTVDVYSKAVERGTDVEFTVWFDLGGAYLSSAAHPQGYPVADKMISDFVKEVAIEATEDELKKQEKLLENLRDDLESLKKKKSGLEDDIKKYEQRIVEAKAKIEENQEQQKAKQGEIEKQNTEVDKVRQKLNTIKSY